jgi:hypothetical protein
MSIKSKLAAGAATLAAVGGFAVAAAGPASASPTCAGCQHVYNAYAFRGALATEGAGTAVNTPIILWYNSPGTTDPGADFIMQSAGYVSSTGGVNQSALNWSTFAGDPVVRFEFAPYGNTSADTYLGLNGTKVAVRNDNPNSIWQEWIVVPLSAKDNGKYGAGYALIDVGQTVNPEDPYILTDPNLGVTGSLVQQDVEHAQFNQYGHIPTNQVWEGVGLDHLKFPPAS